METVSHNQQRVPVKLILTERSEATIERIKINKAEAEQVTEQITKVDQLIDDTYSEIDLLKEKPCIPSVADQVDSLLNGILDIPAVDVSSELQREAKLKQKQDLLDGLTQRRKELQDEHNRLYSKFSKDQRTLTDELLEDWVGSLSDQDRSILFTVIKKHSDTAARSSLHTPFNDKRPADYINKASESLNSMAAMANRKL